MTHIEWNAKHLVCIILPLFIIMQQSVGMCEFARKAHVNGIMKIGMQSNVPVHFHKLKDNVASKQLNRKTCEQNVM